MEEYNEEEVLTRVKFTILQYCKGCKKYINRNKFIIPEGIICEECQLKRIKKLIHQL